MLLSISQSQSGLIDALVLCFASWVKPDCQSLSSCTSPPLWRNSRWSIPSMWESQSMNGRPPINQSVQNWFPIQKTSFFLFYSTCWFPIQKWIKIHEPGIPGWEYRRQEGHRNSVVVVSWPTDWGVGSATGASLRQSQPTHQDVNFSHVTLHSSPRNAEKLWPKVSLLLFPNCFLFMAKWAFINHLMWIMIII